MIYSTHSGMLFAPLTHRATTALSTAILAWIHIRQRGRETVHNCFSCPTSGDEQCTVVLVAFAVTLSALLNADGLCKDWSAGLAN